MAKKARKGRKAGPVTVTKLDGSVEVKPAYNRQQLHKIHGWDKQTRRLITKGEI